MLVAPEYRRSTPSTAASSSGRSATLGNRDERASPGRAHRRGQHHYQAVADPATLAWIDHPVQRLAQVWNERDRIG
jgi:hypothetical protein